MFLYLQRFTLLKYEETHVFIVNNLLPSFLETKALALLCIVVFLHVYVGETLLLRDDFYFVSFI